MKLKISIEREGTRCLVGEIVGEKQDDAFFQYAADYLEKTYAVPVSLSLPLRRTPFSPSETRNYFEGLLPEGFTRQTVAGWLHTNASDYLSILAGLGSDCLGAIQVTREDNPDQGPAGSEPEGYRPLSEDEVRALAAEGVTKSAELVTRSHLSLTGASGKAGLYYSPEKRAWYLPLGSAPSTYIVKQSHVRLRGIVANEQLCLLTAKKMGLPVPESFILDSFGTEDSEILFATRRFDRLFPANPRILDGLPVPYRMHQEDMAQALGIPASEKYETRPAHYLAKMGRLLRTYSAEPLRDLRQLWQTIIFHYLAGNTDGHIKNFSLLYSPDLSEIRLAPVYDIVSTLAYETGSREMALYIGEHNEIHAITRRDFVQAAREIGIGEEMAMQELDRMREAFPAALEEAAGELEAAGFDRVRDIQQKILRQRNSP